ncbi:MAG: hypothetical protein ACKVX7_14630 [Planctomycetota bacterium]
MSGLQVQNRVRIVFLVGVVIAANGCTSKSEDDHEVAATSESCMQCHNGSFHDDYSGPGLENPHPFPGAGSIRCTTCHGGHGDAVGATASHVPPPPEIGDEQFQTQNAQAYFNRLTLAGIDKYEDYVVNGVTYSALDYLQFVNPGDIRVVKEGRSCGQCHMPHAECVAKSPLATEVGILSGARYAMGAANAVPANQGLYEDTAGDYAWRAVTDPDFVFVPTTIGPVGELIEYPVYSVRNQFGPDDIFLNPNYLAAALDDDVNPDNSVITGSPLANLFHEQISFTCGDCHLGSAGANNRYGDFRSSGCTACHMRYSSSGRSDSTDTNIRKNEPLDPDDIDDPERAHVDRHLIRSVAQTLASGETISGIDDHTCAGCHQGSNRTVLQYWGIRLDQNQDVRRGNQYPANPASHVNTALDTRLFDPVINNNTFNGRNANQYLLAEDYDGDDRDDTPADVHYEAGLGCIDCHGSHDVHGGVVGDPANSPLLSRQEQAVAIRCESCHGGVDAYAPVASATTYSGATADCAMDAEGNALKHVVREADGSYILTSRLTGARHYVPQTRDVVVDSGRINPLTQEPVYSAKASYAMGRADGDPANGLGPIQTGAVTPGFSHMDNMSCVACHASWTNNCVGCHLKGEYNNGNNFSNITGERIVFRQLNADFTYQTPVPFQLGVDTHNKISVLSPNTEAHFQWRDMNGDFSQVFSFTDRNGGGNNPAHGLPSLSHNVMMPHSIRGKVSDENEGPRYCNACHLTDEGLANYAAEFNAFRTAMSTSDWGALDFNTLRSHIGLNTNNQINSPIWVHMVAGLGSGIFLFDDRGCPQNPIDDNEDRFGCDGVAPSALFDPLLVARNLDAVVDASGASNGSNNHSMLAPGVGPNLRDGAQNPNQSGPLGATLIRRLSDPATGITLDSWIDADGALQGDAAIHVPQ